MQELEQPEIAIQRKFRNNLKVTIQRKYRNNLKGLNERKEEEAMASMKSGHCHLMWSFNFRKTKWTTNLHLGIIKIPNSKFGDVNQEWIIKGTVS